MAATVAVSAADPIALGARRELFVDRLLVAELKGATLKLHPAQLMPPVSPPRPNGHYATVLRAEDKFQFYYRGDLDPKVTWKTHGIERYHDGEVTLYAESADAIHWKLPQLGRYDLAPFPGGNVVLAHEFAVIHWTPFVEMEANLPQEHLYTACTQPYFRAPHLYVALPNRFMGNRGSATDVLFMTTRGGDRYDREFTQSFIRPGVGKGGWANRANYAAMGIPQTGEAEMSLFLTGGRRYTLRLDGFASVNAPLTGGELITQPFTFTGAKLEINYSTSAAGQIRVELQDADGRPLPGFALEDCEPIWGDHIARFVKWKSGEDVSAQAGKPVRLRFVLEDADLYALKFSP